MATIDPVGGVMYQTEQLDDYQMLTAIVAGKTMKIGLKLKGDTDLMAEAEAADAVKASWPPPARSGRNSPAASSRRQVA